MVAAGQLGRKTGQGFYVSNGLDVYSSLTLGGAWDDAHLSGFGRVTRAA